MKRINFWALLAAGLIGLPVAAFAEDDAKKPETNQSEELFKKLDKNGDGKLVPDEIPEEQGRFFDRLVRIGDKDDNGELTKAEFETALKSSDAPVQGGGAGFGRGAGGPGGAGRPMIDFKQMLERLDKNKDGKLSKDEIPEDGPARFLREMMTRQNKDSLTAEDFEQMRQRMGAAGAFPGGRPEPGEFLKRLDKNGDGKLQKDELPEPMQERFGRIFEKLGKKELSGEEFGKALAELGPPPGAPGAGNPGGRPNPEEQFKRMDTNGDGKVTLDEVPEQFRDRVRPLFENAKKDVLTLDDVRAFGQARDGERRPGGERPDAARPDEARAEGRRPNPERPDGRRPDAERPDARPDGERPDARRPDGERRPETRPGERRPDGDRRPEGQPPRDGDRRPDGQPPRDGDRRPEGDGRRGPMPRFFQLLDRNQDGRLSRDELDRLREVFNELDRNKDGQLDGAELLGPPQQGPQDGRGPGAGRPDGDRRPDGNRPPEGRRPDGQPPRDGDRRPDARRPDGDRPREGDRRPEGQPPRDGERRPEAGRPRDGERRPEADRPRDGERRPDPRPEGRPPRRDGDDEKPSDNDK